MTNTHIFAQNGNYQYTEITPTENMEGGGRGEARGGGGRGREGDMKGERGSEQGCRGDREERGGGGKGHQFSYYSLTK